MVAMKWRLLKLSLTLLKKLINYSQRIPKLNYYLPDGISMRVKYLICGITLNKMKFALMSTYKSQKINVKL